MPYCSVQNSVCPMGSPLWICRYSKPSVLIWRLTLSSGFWFPVLFLGLVAQHFHSDDHFVLANIYSKQYLCVGKLTFNNNKKHSFWGKELICNQCGTIGGFRTRDWFDLYFRKITLEAVRRKEQKRWFKEAGFSLRMKDACLPQSKLWHLVELIKSIVNIKN